MNKRSIFFIIAAFMISFSVFFMGYVQTLEPKEVYRVYLRGKEIGLIYSKEDLYEYIDDQQQSIKNKYKVDKVYAPNTLDIVKDITYSDDISSVATIYDKISDIEPFTIKGYVVNIKGIEEQTEENEKKIKTKDKKVYVLNKKVFEDAVRNTAIAFVGEDRYTSYESGNEAKKDTEAVGTYTENIYIKNEITIKEGYISTEEQIFLNKKDLSKYLLFGTLEKQKTYTVKDGETIEDIAFNNKLSAEEFLIANPEFTGADNLISKGQVVTLGEIVPAFKLIEEQHVVEEQVKRYNTKIEYDKTMYEGKEKVKQKGKNGRIKVTKKLQKENGVINSAVITNSEELEPSIQKIIVKGSKKRNNSSGWGGNNGGYSEPVSGKAPTITGDWYWPTNVPYVISSGYAYRWGKLHSGIDISGTGYGSPIYAANDGVVAEAGSRWPNGNYIMIRHSNGYHTMYAHLSTIKVSNGAKVKRGQVIGSMGKSGMATGTHLHFGVYYSKQVSVSNTFNPMVLFK